MTDENNHEEKKSRPQEMEIEQIKQIYDYTKFHIGMYSTLLTILIAIVTFSRGKVPTEPLSQQSQDIIFRIIILLLIGGIAGALVASRIVYGPWKKTEFRIEDSWFWKKRPSESRTWWKCNWWVSYADICLTIEHYAFWLALFYAIVAF